MRNYVEEFYEDSIVYVLWIAAGVIGGKSALSNNVCDLTYWHVEVMRPG